MSPRGRKTAPSARRSHESKASAELRIWLRPWSRCCVRLSFYRAEWICFDLHAFGMVGTDMANKIVTFTPKQIADPGIRELVDFLERLTQDGEITEDEIAALSDALAREQVDQSTPGVEFLQTLLSGVDFTGEIDVSRRAEIHRAILRVLPKAQRAEAERARQQAGIKRAMLRRHEATLPTQRQLDYITDLGGCPSPGMTREDASRLIDRLSERGIGEASQRQIDYLIDLGGYPFPGMTSEEASDMIDSFESRPAKAGCFSAILLLLALQGIAVTAWLSLC